MKICEACLCHILVLAIQFFCEVEGDVGNDNENCRHSWKFHLFSVVFIESQLGLALSKLKLSQINHKNFLHRLLKSHRQIASNDSILQGSFLYFYRLYFSLSFLCLLSIRYFSFTSSFLPILIILDAYETKTETGKRIVITGDSYNTDIEDLSIISEKPQCE